MIFNAVFSTRTEDFDLWSREETNSIGVLVFRATGTFSSAIVRDKSGDRSVSVSKSGDYYSIEFRLRSKDFMVKLGSEPWVRFETLELNEQTGDVDSFGGESIPEPFSSNPLLDYFLHSDVQPGVVVVG